MSSPHADVHADLSASVKAYAASAGGLKRLRDLRDEPSGFDPAGWRRAGELGWLGMLVPEGQGGMALGLDEAAVLARAAGRSLLPEPVLAGAVLAAPLLARGRGGCCSSALSDLLRGEAFVAVAWQERIGEIDVARTETEVVVSKGRRVLRGTKLFVVFGAAAQGYLVSARDESGVGLYWVDRARPGVDYRALRRADGSEHGSLALDDVLLDERDTVLEPGAGARMLAAAIDATVVASAAELLGVAERALELTLEQLRSRVQFGQPIGSFQALQHRCVDMFIEKELAVSALTAVLAEWSQADLPRRSALASRVKARCADAALDICRRAIQMHGAMGFTDECDVGLYLKRALVCSAWLGNAQVHKRRYARLALADAGKAREQEAAA